MDEGQFKKEVKQYMHENVEEHVDFTYLQVNATQLAEDAAQHFAIGVSIYGTDDEEYFWPEQDFFDLAAEVALEWEKEASKPYVGGL